MARRSETSGLLSPTESNRSWAATLRDDDQIEAALPATRAHPLKPGSQKEISLINYLDDCILQITRRYAKKYSEAGERPDAVAGYMTYEEVVLDVNPLLDVIWISSTASLQIPYLLSLAGIACEYMPAFPFSPIALRLLQRFDLAFAQLLHRNPAPGLSTSAVNMTERVRIKSLVEETRVVALQAASSSGLASSNEVLSAEDDSNWEDDDTNDFSDEDVGETSKSLGLSQIYEQTLQILGDSLT